MKKKTKVLLTILFIISLFNLLNLVYKCFTPNIDIGKTILSLIGCLFMLILIILPLFSNKKLKLEIPDSMYTMFVVFCFCGIILGDVNDFFTRFSSYDSLLHFISGIMLSVLGFIIINTFCQKSIKSPLSPFFISFFAFTFALSLGVFWEIIEYNFDKYLDTNMQVYRNRYTNENYVGREALNDTMKDLMLDASGGLIVSLVGYTDLRHNKKGFSSSTLQIKK